ncbi:hypothetical protein CA983_00600 [Streptomyces swartbergensis]|uniref:Uncharacterized protein n=1 Tax=Streptomyces swartbergensis TaxID=487165 RepID=A0A2C9ZNR5_9ACTN|nr:hypothetical protein CA983_00600 [Streptomyces swartbergensis]
MRPFRIYDGPSETHRFAIARRAVRPYRQPRTGAAPTADLTASSQDAARGIDPSVAHRVAPGRPGGRPIGQGNEGH